MKRATPIILSPAERTLLNSWTEENNYPLRLVKRARIICMAADGIQNREIAQELGVSRPTVQLWRERFLALRLAGLEKDAPRPGRIPSIPLEKVQAVVDATLHATPPNASRWSARSMAEAQGISQATVRRIWKRHDLKPGLIHACEENRDKRFPEELYDVVGLYLNPPDKSLVFCVDEKTHIQTLDGTGSALPMETGPCGTLRQDRRRNGTTGLFSSLSRLERTVIGDCLLRHRHKEFIRFLKKIDDEIPATLDLQMIVDNEGTHRHPGVTAWLKRHPRFRLFVIPPSAVWLNMVEQCFRELTRKRIHGGIFHNVPDLIGCIRKYVRNHGQSPRVFVWTAPSAQMPPEVTINEEIPDTSG